jgi:hypothetical protein
VRAEQEAHLATQQDLGDVKAALASANARASEAQEAAAAAAGRAVVAETRVASMASSDDQVLLRTLQERLEQQEQQLAAARVAAAEAALLPELRAALVAARTQAAAGSNAAAALAASQRTVTELQEQLDVWRSSCRVRVAPCAVRPACVLSVHVTCGCGCCTTHDHRCTHAHAPVVVLTHARDITHCPGWAWCGLCQSPGAPGAEGKARGG